MSDQWALHFQFVSRTAKLANNAQQIPHVHKRRRLSWTTFIKLAFSATLSSAYHFSLAKAVCYLFSVYTYSTVYVRPCVFAKVGNRMQVEVSDFVEWMKLEPQSVVWIPVMHRLAGAEAAEHNSRCAVCRTAPIVGIRSVSSFIACN